MSLVTRLSRIVDLFLFFHGNTADKILKFTLLRKEDANYAKFFTCATHDIYIYILRLRLSFLLCLGRCTIPLLLLTMYSIEDSGFIEATCLSSLLCSMNTAIGLTIRPE